MIHYNTTNLSFIKVYHFLKKKKVKNCTFFLELLDETLEHVDPHDPNLTEEQKQRIIIECTKNIWYFLRECVRIQNAGVVPFELSLGNLALLFVSYLNLCSIVVMPRQTGKTMAEMVFLTWVLYFGGNNSESMIVAQNDKKIQDNMRRIRNVRDGLPPYLIFKTSQDRDGAEMMDFKSLGNKIINTTVGKNAVDADAKGRGCSLSILSIDEGSFIDNIDVFYKAAVLAWSNTAEAAQKFGLPNHVCFTTTPGYLTEESGQWMFQFIQDSLPFDESMYDLDRDQIIELMKHGSKRRFLYIEYQYWDLGKDDEYFQRMIVDCGGDWDAIEREVLLKWKAVTKNHPLGQQALARLDKCVRKPIHIVVLNDMYRMKMYRDPELLDWSLPYVISVDCANNVGADYSAICVQDPYTYEVIATIRTNMYSTMFFAELIADLMVKYYYKSIAIIERNLNGATVIDRILQISPGIEQRIYAGKYDAKTTEPIELGVTMDKKLRDFIYGNVLKISVDDSYDRIYDSTIIDEIKSLIKTRNGRIDHPPEGHDDLLITYLYGRWFLLYAEYVERYIDPLKIGCLSHEFNPDIEDKEMQEIKNRRLSDISDEEYGKELEAKRKQYVRSGITSPGQTLQTLEEQHKQIMEGSFGSSNRSNNKLNDIFDTMSRMHETMDPMKNYQGIVDEKNDNGAMHEISTSSLESELDRERDPNVADSIYNERAQDVTIGNKVSIDTDSQFRRQVASQYDNDIIDLRNFMKQFR